MAVKSRSKIIMGSIYVEGELNISQLVQGENVPGSLTMIKSKDKNRESCFH